jgi:hypothetical protein
MGKIATCLPTFFKFLSDPNNGFSSMLKFLYMPKLCLCNYVSAYITVILSVCVPFIFTCKIYILDRFPPTKYYNLKFSINTQLRR